MQVSNGNYIKAKRNGYLFVHVSNESQCSVFFDDLSVEHLSGPLLEENHYYPFGMQMAGISSKSIKASDYIGTKKGFQGQEYTADLGTNWNQFKWRNYDPQIGRFIQIGPLSSDYTSRSTYAFSENRVVTHIEIEGLESKPINPSATLWRAAGITSSKTLTDIRSNAWNASPEVRRRIERAWKFRSFHNMDWFWAFFSPQIP